MAARPPDGAPSATMCPAGQLDHPVGDPGDLPVVRDHDDGLAGLCLGPQQLQDLHAGAEVELTRRLVGQQDRVTGGQRPGDRHALLLPTG